MPTRPLLLASVLLASCASGPPTGNHGAACTSSDDCTPGQACVADACRNLCASDKDCTIGTCDPAGYCAGDAASGVPQIATVSGNSANPDVIEDGLLVQGTHLGDATFALEVVASAWPTTSPVDLEIRRASDTEVELILPADTYSGSFTLVATNQAGSDQAGVTLELPEVTSQLVLDRLNAATGKVAFGVLPTGSGPGQVAPGNHSHGEYAVVDHLHPEYLPRTEGLRYGNMEPNAALDSTTGWTTRSGTLNSVAVPDGAAGDYVFENSAGEVVWGYSESWQPIDPTRTYLVTGSFRESVAGTAGVVYLAVLLRDATGADIGGDGSWWFYPVSSVQPGTGWLRGAAEFGAGTARPFPADAVDMSVGFILNYTSGNNPGDRVHQVQGLGLYEVTPSAYRSEAWRTVTLGAGVSVYGGTYAVPSFHRDETGRVCLRGLVGTVPYVDGYSTVGTLPPGYNSGARRIFLQLSDVGPLRVDINNTSILVRTVGVTAGLAWLSLEGICF